MKSIFTSFIIGLVLAFGALAHANPNYCQIIFGEQLDELALPVENVEFAEAFAKKHDLPVEIVEVGPEVRPMKRMLIALDITNPALLAAYKEAYHLQTGNGKNIAGFIVLEGYNSEGYNALHIRTSANEYYRNDYYTKELETYKDQTQADILGYGTPVPIKDAEKTNVEYFLKNKAERAPCKNENCAAWISQIELGQTTKDATDAQRQFMANRLEISRTIENVEMQRRLIHASNAEVNTIFVFVRGEAGYKEFKAGPKKSLIAVPKKPFNEIIKNFEFGNPEADQAISVLPDGTTVFVPIAAGASSKGLTALAKRAGEMQKGLDVHVLVNGVSENIFREGIEGSNGKFRVHALFLGGNLRKLHSEGRVNYIPGNLADFITYVKRGEPEFDYGAILVRVAPKDADGKYSLGPNHDHIMSIIKAKPNIKIIAEINENIPRTRGDNFLTEAQITSSFTSKDQIIGPEKMAVTDVEAKIGENISGLIPDGATIQLGIGLAFGGLPTGLKNRGVKDIKIHTEMFGNDLMDIMTNGNATEATTGFAYGNKDLYKWLNGNQTVTFKSTAEVNDPGSVSKIPNFHAVNTALQVNLYGESNATMGPNGRISSPGGQVEFMTGAARSQNGKAIIAVRSTAKNDTLSTIVLDLYKGPITTPNESVTHVVTEYGIAKLIGENERTRAISLINIAHPKFRESLFNEALEANLVREADRAKLKT